MVQLNKFLIVGKYGTQLLVNTPEEAFFASTACYELLDGPGYNTDIGEWVETQIEAEPWNGNSFYRLTRDQFDPYVLLYIMLPVYEFVGGQWVDITEAFRIRLKEEINSYA